MPPHVGQEYNLQRSWQRRTQQGSYRRALSLQGDVWICMADMLPSDSEMSLDKQYTNADILFKGRTTLRPEGLVNYWQRPLGRNILPLNNISSCVLYISINATMSLYSIMLSSDLCWLCTQHACSGISKVCSLESRVTRVHFEKVIMENLSGVTVGSPMVGTPINLVPAVIPLRFSMITTLRSYYQNQSSLKESFESHAAVVEAHVMTVKLVFWGAVGL